MKTTIHMNETHWGKTAVVVICDGLGLSMVTVLDNDPSVAVVHDLSVHVSARGSGLGNAVLNMSEDVSRHMGADTARLSVDPESWKAEWYKRHGYREKGLVDFRGCDCLVLEKELRKDEK